MTDTAATVNTYLTQPLLSYAARKALIERAKRDERARAITRKYMES